MFGETLVLFGAGAALAAAWSGDGSLIAGVSDHGTHLEVSVKDYPRSYQPAAGATSTPFQNATRPVTCRAAGSGEG